MKKQPGLIKTESAKESLKTNKAFEAFNKLKNLSE